MRKHTYVFLLNVAACLRVCMPVYAYALQDANAKNCNAHVNIRDVAPMRDAILVWDETICCHLLLVFGYFVMSSFSSFCHVRC